MRTLIQIGAEKAAVEAVQGAILAIVMCPAADAVKTAALEALGKSLEVRNVTIQNCDLRMGGDVPPPARGKAKTRRKARR